MNVDEWMGWIQDFLEARINDAPDERCKEFAQNLWDLTADADAPEGRTDWGMNRDE